MCTQGDPLSAVIPFDTIEFLTTTIQVPPRDASARAVFALCAVACFPRGVGCVCMLCSAGAVHVLQFSGCVQVLVCVCRSTLSLSRFEHARVRERCVCACEWNQGYLEPSTCLFRRAFLHTMASGTRSVVALYIIQETNVEVCGEGVDGWWLVWLRAGEAPVRGVALDDCRWLLARCGAAALRRCGTATSWRGGVVACCGNVGGAGCPGWPRFPGRPSLRQHPGSAPDGGQPTPRGTVLVHWYVPV